MQGLPPILVFLSAIHESINSGGKHEVMIDRHPALSIVLRWYGTQVKTKQHREVAYKISKLIVTMLFFLGNYYICAISMAARAICANLFCFTWVVSSLQRCYLSSRNINLDQNALTSLFCFTRVVSSLQNCCYLSSRILTSISTR